jgi:hypothetical protein
VPATLRIGGAQRQVDSAILTTATMNFIKRDKQTIIVLGCQHLFQLVENESNPRFRHLVESIIEEH